LRNRQQQQHRRGYGEDFEENYALHLNFPHRNLDAPRYNVWLSIYNTGLCRDQPGCNAERPLR
jgi:hypothetical protein